MCYQFLHTAACSSGPRSLWSEPLNHWHLHNNQIALSDTQALNPHRSSCSSPHTWLTGEQPQRDPTGLFTTCHLTQSLLLCCIFDAPAATCSFQASAAFKQLTFNSRNTCGRNVWKVKWGGSVHFYCNCQFIIHYSVLFKLNAMIKDVILVWDKVASHCSFCLTCGPFNACWMTYTL